MHELTSPPRRHKLRIRSAGYILDLDIPPRRPMLGSWLTDRHLSMVFAEAGVGKSMFTLVCALAIAGGGRVFGRWQANAPRRVMIVDGEMDNVELKERLGALLTAGDGVSLEQVRKNLHVVSRLDQGRGAFVDLTDVDWRHTIMEEAKEHHADLVIFDNFSTLATVEDENAATSFDPVMNLMLDLKAEGRSCILVHHANKSGGYRGTSKMVVPLDSVIRLKHPGGIESKKGAHFDVSFVKVRGLRGEDTNAFTAKLEAGPEGGRRWSVEISAADMVGRVVAMNKSLLFSTCAAIARELDVDRSTVMRYRNKAFADNLITRPQWEANEKMAADPESRPVENFELSSEEPNAFGSEDSDADCLPF